MSLADLKKDVTGRMAIFLINFVVLTFLSFLVLFSNRSLPENRSYALLALGTALAGLTRFFTELCETVKVAQFWIQIVWAILFFLPSFLVMFSIHVSGLKTEKIRYQYCFIISFVFLALNFTPLFIKTVYKAEHFFQIVPGIFFYVFVVYIVVLFCVLVVSVSKQIKNSNYLQRKRLQSFRGVLIIGALLSVTYLFEWMRKDAYFYISCAVTPMFLWMAYISLYHRSVTLGNLVRRILIITGMALLCTAIFLLLILVMESILSRPIDYRLIFPALIASFVIVVFYGALNKHMTFFMTKIFFHKQFEGERVSRDLSKHIMSILKRGEIFNYILSTAGYLLGTKKLAIFSPELSGDTYNFQACIGVDPEVLSTISFSKRSYFMKYLNETKKNILWETIIADYRKIKMREELEPLAARGFVYFIPFISRDNISAVMVVGDKNGDPIYTDEDRLLLSGLVANGTMAIENIQLMELNERLKELDEMKRDFVSNVTHELKSPLTAIQSCVEFLLKKKGGDLTRFQIDYLVMVQNNTARLTRFIMQLLDISRIEAARLDLYKEDVSLPTLAQEIALLFGPYAEEKGIKIRVSSQPDIMEIMADQDKLKQVFTNLISNALKFTDHGEIRIYIADRHDCLEVKLTDTGIGIPKEALNRLFDKFYQVKETHKEKKYGGTGLGLAIVKGIIDAHGGRLWVESELGKGTIFTFTLPKYSWE